jgi:hypothetical protein
VPGPQWPSASRSFMLVLAGNDIALGVGDESADHSLVKLFDMAGHGNKHLWLVVGIHEDRES